ncbi:hypothetical protein D3C81_1299850 [compost metagenome]
MGQFRFLEANLGLFGQADQLRSRGRNLLFQRDGGLSGGWRWGTCGSCIICNLAPEMLHQGAEPFVEALEIRRQTPLAILAVDVRHHDGLFPGEGVASEGAGGDDLTSWVFDQKG